MFQIGGIFQWKKKTIPLISELASIVGSEHVITNSTSLSVYECDAATVFKALPDVVVFPTTTQEISAIVKLANKHNVPFVARGAGTGLSGGMLTVNGGIIIALNRMNRILEIDLANSAGSSRTGCCKPMADTSRSK